MSKVVPQIEIGKSPEDFLSATHSFWLPPDTLFGNLSLKQLKIITRLDRANAMLQQIYKIHPLLISGKLLLKGEHEAYSYLLEELIYHIRRSADELISMYSFLADFEKTGKYSHQVEIDSIGTLLSNELAKSNPLFIRHLPLLKQLNEISNAYKHSFVNSDLNLIGANEPCVYALALKYNKLDKGMVFHSLALREVIGGFSSFYVEITSWLRGFSERHRNER
jgi:hypothetical protein